MWNEKASNELKQLRLNARPNAQQQARIAELQGLKAGAGKVVQNPINQTAATGQTQQAANPQLQQALGGLAAAGTGISDRSITPENFAPKRAEYEQQQLSSITRGWDTRQAQQKQQLEQDLYNRGYRPDQTTTEGPGSWNGMQSQFTQDWNNSYLDAGAKAAQLGGEEFDRMFGAQEDMIGNQMTRENYLGQLASSGLDRASQEKMTAAQQKNAIRIANIQMARSGGGRPAAAPTADRGFDVI